MFFRWKSVNSTLLSLSWRKFNLHLDSLENVNFLRNDTEDGDMKRPHTEKSISLELCLRGIQSKQSVRCAFDEMNELFLGLSISLDFSKNNSSYSRLLSV